MIFTFTEKKFTISFYLLKMCCIIFTEFIEGICCEKQHAFKGDNMDKKEIALKAVRALKKKYPDSMCSLDAESTRSFPTI